MTCWPGVQVLWLETKGRVPSNIGFGGVFGWYSEGLIPVGVPERPPDYFIVQAGRLAVVDFENLQWERLEKEGFEVALRGLPGLAERWNEPSRREPSASLRVHCATNHRC